MSMKSPIISTARRRALGFLVRIGQNIGQANAYWFGVCKIFRLKRLVWII